MKTICKSCGSTDGTKKQMPGSIIIELILWLMFVIPGLIYTIWRYNATVRVCRDCGSRDVIPMKSPLGQQVVAQVREFKAANPEKPSSALRFGNWIGQSLRSRNK